MRFLYLPLQTRKFKELLENRLGWEFQKKSAVDGIYFEEDDEVNISASGFVLSFFLFRSYH
jgi:hypothetical protein